VIPAYSVDNPELVIQEIPWVDTKFQRSRWHRQRTKGWERIAVGAAPEMIGVVEEEVMVMITIMTMTTITTMTMIRPVTVVGR
jgi:hypothetical protein